MSKSFRLRPYQKNAVAAVIERYKERKQRRMLPYLPTGAGKTVIAAHIIKALRTTPNFGKVLFVAHRREIINQTASTIKRHSPLLRIQIEQGKRKSRGECAVTIASVQSPVRRKEKYDPTEYALIICDECHRALARSWEQVIDYFHSKAGKDALLLGMTATPQRKGRQSSPRTLLRSMLSAGCRINEMGEDAAENTITASIAGLTPGQIEAIEDDFQNEFGMELELKGQLSLFLD